MEKSNRRKLTILFLILFFVGTIVQCVFLFSIAAEKRENRYQEATVYGQSLANAIALTLEQSVDSSESLRYFYSMYGDEIFEDFDEIAERIMADNPVISGIYIAPKGVIRAAYPEKVNASTIGFAMLEDPEQGPRARLAVESGKVTVAGPHELVEGGKGLIIRNPVFEQGEFVGFTIVVLDWDKFVNQVLSNTKSTSMKYKFAVWKADHDETALTDSEGYILRNTQKTISKDMDIAFSVPNDTWHLVVEPVEGWYVAYEMRYQIVISVFFFFTLLTLSLFLYSSELKKAGLREQLRRSEEHKAYTEKLAEALLLAEEANAAKTIFLNNMSHDIRTPMNAILGFTGLMKHELQDPEQLREHLAKVEISGEYLLSLINNMLEVARIDSGMENIDEEFVDLYDEKSSVPPLLENEIKKKNLILTSEMDIQHRYVLTDLQKLMEISMNLISNAIKYTPEGGSIHVRLQELPSDREGFALYQTTVSDTGIGMSEEFQKQIFDSFSRERNSTESKVIGSGLGMSIVKRLVDLLGGSITVSSEPGKGSTFTTMIYHRIVENPEEYLKDLHEAIAPNRIDLTGRRILLAEDNELNAEIAIAILSDLGAGIEHAKDGVECVNMMTDHDAGYYDMILMDIQMPNLNGYDATRRIRELSEPEKAGIPIVAMTANAFAEDREKALDAGMNGHLSKPIEITKLMDMFASLFP